MNYKALQSLIRSTDGKMFSVEFTKADGTVRPMNCRLDVKKHLKGGTSTTAHKENLITVFDVQKGGYRCINLDTLTKFKFAGKEYIIK